MMSYWFDESEAPAGIVVRTFHSATGRQCLGCKNEAGEWFDIHGHKLQVHVYLPLGNRYQFPKDYDTSISPLPANQAPQERVVWGLYCGSKTRKQIAVRVVRHPDGWKNIFGGVVGTPTYFIPIKTEEGMPQDESCVGFSETPPNDVINRPSHYIGEGGLECDKALCAFGLDKNAYLYQAAAYIFRAGKKDESKFLEDIRKARRFLEMAINRYEEQHGAG